jgi:hypothetical protein
MTPLPLSWPVLHRCWGSVRQHDETCQRTHEALDGGSAAARKRLQEGTIRDRRSGRCRDAACAGCPSPELDAAEHRRKSTMREAW